LQRPTKIEAEPNGNDSFNAEFSTLYGALGRLETANLTGWNDGLSIGLDEHPIEFSPTEVQ
jgi:hypothetical protein